MKTDLISDHFRVNEHKTCKIQFIYFTFCNCTFFFSANYYEYQVTEKLKATIYSIYSVGRHSRQSLKRFVL